MSDTNRIDMVTVDLAKPLQREKCGALLATGDENANRFGAYIVRNGASVDLTGCTVSGSFIRADGVTVPLEGAAEGNTVHVDLTAQCYAVDGVFSLALKVIGEDYAHTLRIVEGYIRRTDTGKYIDPDETVYNTEELKTLMKELDGITNPGTADDLLKGKEMIGADGKRVTGAMEATKSAVPKEVNFFDYDGTCVYSYTVEEAQALTELPAGPVHDGLVFDGWNWSLEDVNALTSAMNIGAMYTTDDGTTRLYINLTEGRTSPMLGICVSGTVTVDWGDGTEPDTLIGTDSTKTIWTENHAYAAPGDYVIRLTVDGSAIIAASNGGGSYSPLLRQTSANDSRNYAYLNALRHVEIGENVIGIGQLAFGYCGSLETVSVPHNAKVGGYYPFTYCTMLKALTIPQGLDAVGTGMFQRCFALKRVAIPKGITLIDSNAFNYCTALVNVTIPHGVEKINYNAFYYCYNLESVIIPDSVLNIGNSVFSECCTLGSMTIPDSVTSIGSSMLRNCTRMENLIISSGVTSIGTETVYGGKTLVNVIVRGNVANIASKAFNTCNGVKLYDFTACTAVPTLAATDVFTGIPNDCEIRVPAALYAEWIAAANWSTYANNIKAY